MRQGNTLLHVKSGDVVRVEIGDNDAADMFVATFDFIQMQAWQNSEDKGFHSKALNDGEKIALMHSELSEALEGFRHGNPESDKIPGFSAAEEEYADTIIRIMDHAEQRQLRVAEAILAKMAMNAGRPLMHGGKAF